jgi:hypothetical protein
VAGAKSLDSEKVWSSVNHSILSEVGSPTRGRYSSRPLFYMQIQSTRRLDFYFKTFLVLLFSLILYWSFRLGEDRVIKA